MEKEFYVSYEGVIKIKAKNKKDAEKKFWEIMKDKANVINSIEKKWKKGVDKTPFLRYTIIVKEVNTMKNNIHKKMTYEDKFDRKYACWVENNRKAWHFWKRKTSKDFRRKMKKVLDNSAE